MFKVNDDYDGMIAAAVQATHSDDIAKILKYIQSKYTVPTNFEKHVRKKWGQMEKRKPETPISPPIKASKQARRAIVSLPFGSNLLPDEILHQVFRFLPPFDLYKVMGVCVQWRNISQDKSLRRVMRLSSLSFVPLSFLRTVLLNSLHHLDLSGCPITDYMASLLAQKPPPPLKRLHTLNISKCNLLTPTGLSHLFSAFSSATPTLTSLNIAECRIDDGVILQYVSKFTNLKFLDISRIWMMSTNAFFSITQNCTKLEQVNMVNLTFISDAAVVSLAENCRNLSHVDMSCCYNLTTNTLACLADRKLEFLSIRSISVGSEFSLPSTLRHLDMSKCVGMTDQYLAPIIATSSNLETLDLAECPDLTDASLDLIAAHLRTTLKSLNLSGCLGLTPEAVEVLLSRFPHLVELQIAHLNLSDATFVNLAASFSDLRHLDISHNAKVTDAGILALARASQRLQAFACDGMRTRGSPTSPAFRKCGVTVESLAHLRKHCKHLRSLSLSGTLGFDIHATHLIALAKACAFLEIICISGDGAAASAQQSAEKLLRDKICAVNPNVKIVCK